MPRRLIMLSVLVALSAFSTGCCGRIRQCIANRWHAHHPYAGGCCTPAFKVAAPVGCSTCGPGPAAGAIVYQGPVTVSAPYGMTPGSTPTIGQPMPLIGSGSVPGAMPPK
ncbi:MAG TPA: hypothetical protein VGL71_10030 [Urbifossiella sp.]